MLSGDLWLSCTTPLKHSPHSRLGVQGPAGVSAINQLMRSNGVWRGLVLMEQASFPLADIGVEPSSSILRMRGRLYR